MAELDVGTTQLDPSEEFSIDNFLQRSSPSEDLVHLHGNAFDRSRRVSVVVSGQVLQGSYWGGVSTEWKDEGFLERIRLKKEFDEGLNEIDRMQGVIDRKLEKVQQAGNELSKLVTNLQELADRVEETD